MPPPPPVQPEELAPKLLSIELVLGHRTVASSIPGLPNPCIQEVPQVNGQAFAGNGVATVELFQLVSGDVERTFRGNAKQAAPGHPRVRDVIEHSLVPISIIGRFVVEFRE